MEIIKKLKKLITCNRGVTFIEIMVAVAILGISMTYLAVDSKFTSKTIFGLNEKDNMLNAAQEAMERYKASHIIDEGINYNGYTVEVKTEGAVDEALQPIPCLDKVTFTVKSKQSFSDTRYNLDDIVLVSYIYNTNTSPPAAPTNLLATPTQTGIVLEWNSVPYANYYTIKRSETQGGPYTVLADNITTVKYTDATALDRINSTFYYVISATNDFGTSANSNEAWATIQIRTTILSAVADSYTDSSNWFTTHGSDTTLSFGKKDQYEPFLKFNVSNGSITGSTATGNVISAVLRLYGRNSTATSALSADIDQVSDDSWTESGLSWWDSPSMGTKIGSMSFTNSAAYKELDVTSYVVAEKAIDGVAGFGVYSNVNNTGILNSKENTSNQPQIVVTWTPMQPPAAPQNLVGTPDDKKANLSWTAVQGAETYVIRGSASSGGPYTIINSTTTSNSYTDTGLTNGVAYYYVVSAKNGNGESSYSNQVSVVPNVTNYAVLTPQADSYVRDGVNAGTNYGTSQILQAKNTSTAGEKRVSYYKFDLSDIRGGIINAKLAIYGSNIESTSDITVAGYDVSDTSWQESAINYTNAPALGAEIGTANVSSIPAYTEIDITNYINTKLSSDKIANIGVQVKNSGDLSAFNSKESSSNKPQLIIWKTLLAPLAPEELNAVPGDSRVDLSWDASFEADSYNIKRSTTSGGPYTTIAAKYTGTTYTDIAVTNKTRYYYVVSAINKIGESSNSEQVSAMPNIVSQVSLAPTADARVESYYPSNYYGTATSLSVVNDGTNNKKTYMRFDFTGITYNPVVSAKLRIYGSSTVDNYKVNVHGVSDIAWTEAGIKWSNAPAIETQIATTNINTSSQYYEIDVTDYVASQLESKSMVSLGLYTDVTGVDSSVFNSKEASGGKPELLVNMVQGAPKQPKNLLAVGGNRYVDLSWTAAEGAASYNIKRGTINGGPYSTIATGVTSTTYRNTGLSNNTDYYYIVTAVNTNGESIPSNEVCGLPSNTTRTQALMPTDDSYVRDGDYAETNFGTAGVIDTYRSYSTNDGNNRVIYLKYNLSTITSNPTSATLMFTGRNITDRNNITVNIYSLTNDTWDEHTINWDNAPTYNSYLGAMTITRSYSTRSLSITSYARTEWAGNKILGLYIKASTYSRIADLSSKEGTDTPILQINY